MRGFGLEVAGHNSEWSISLTITLYGIPNCDTVKKARVWLEGRGLAYALHDYKKAGADAAQVADWVARAGLDKVLNRAGTTFRKLPEADREGLDGGTAAGVAKAVALMVANPSCIKRPVLDHPGGLLVGFREAEWAAALG